MRKNFYAVLLIFTLCFFAACGSIMAPERYVPTAEQISDEEVFASNVGAVFKILASGDGVSWHGTGSGFFVSETGIAVTNHHVIVGAQYAEAETEDGRRFQIIGYYYYDIDNDLALIQVDSRGEHFQYVSFGNPEPRVLSAGNPVFAIGSPAGVRNVFSDGQVVNHLTEFAFGNEGGHIYRVRGIIQATAEIAPGSSGGALFNNRGQVVGITSAVSEMRPGHSFSVPITRVDLSSVTARRFRPLPVAMPGIIPGFVYAAPYQFVPTFNASATHAEFISGIAIDPEFEGPTLAAHYEFVYGYKVAAQHAYDEASNYSAVLLAHGFLWQGNHEMDVWMSFFYHPAQNASLLLGYNHHDNVMMIVLGRGNVYPLLAADAPASPPVQQIEPEPPHVEPTPPPQTEPAPPQTETTPPQTDSASHSSVIGRWERVATHNEWVTWGGSGQNVVLVLSFSDYGLGFTTVGNNFSDFDDGHVELLFWSKENSLLTIITHNPIGVAGRDLHYRIFEYAEELFLTISWDHTERTFRKVQ